MRVAVEGCCHGELDAIYNALETTLPDGSRLVLEVQQHLGDDRVRTVAMSTTKAQTHTKGHDTGVRHLSPNPLR